jgi:hypothetical protein
MYLLHHMEIYFTLLSSIYERGSAGQYMEQLTSQWHAATSSYFLVKPDFDDFWTL